MLRPHTVFSVIVTRESSCVYFASISQVDDLNIHKHWFFITTSLFFGFIYFVTLRHRLTKVLIKNQLHTLLALVPWWLSPFLKHSVDLGSITLNFLSLLVVANKDPFLIYMNPLLSKNYAYIHLCVEIIHPRNYTQ